MVTVVHRSHRPRILYLVTRAERGGAQTHVLTLAQSLREDWAVEVATGECGFLTEACESNSIPVHVVRHLQRGVNPWLDANALWQLRCLLQRVRPDLIHVHTFKAGFLGRLAAASANVPSVYTLHSWVPTTQGMSRAWKAIAGPCERRAAQWCDRVISVSQEGARVARSEGLAVRKDIALIHNGIEDCTERATLPDRNDPRIVMVARFLAPKDHKTLLRAFAKVPHGRLCLVGDGPRRAEMEALAREISIEDRVAFLGNRDDVRVLLADSDLFVLSSASEMLPISVLEAMRAGLPIIASNVGGVPELIENEVSGLLVQPGSIAELGGALQRLLADIELRRRLGRAARERFCEHFVASRQSEKTAALYREVLVERGSRAFASEEAYSPVPSSTAP